MKRLRPWLALIAILWLATGLRFFRLDAQSFWNDEGNSASLSARSPELIVEGTASDIHPPLYYLLLHGWRQLAGDSEFALRALSAFAGVLLVAGTFALGRHLFAGTTLPALVATLITAFNPALVYYSQEARMYELLGLLAVLATLSLYLFRPWLAGRRRTWSYGLAYLLLVVAGLYTHYFFAAMLLAHNFLIFVWLLFRRVDLKRTLLGWAGLMMTAVLAFLPWLPIFLRQTGDRPGDAIPILSFLVDGARWLALGATIEPAPARWHLVAFALLLLLAFIPWKMTAEAVTTNPPVSHPRSSIPGISLISALSLLAIPILLMLVAGTTRPAYFKFMIVAIPFMALLIGRGVATGWNLAQYVPATRIPLLLLLAAGGGGVLWGTARSLDNLYFDPAYARDDYRAMAARISREAHPNAGIILSAPNQWEVFTYYYQDGAPVYPLPRGEPDQAQLASELEAIADRHDRLYALFWGEAERDPDRPVERWLDRHAYKAGDEWVGGVRFVTYAVPREPATEPETYTNLHFGDQIALTGYAIQGEQVRPGEILQVTLFWEAIRPVAQRYKVFLHLVNEQGEPLAQRDAEPGGGMVPTTTWTPGEPIIDNHGILIPSSVHPGTYSLNLGLYELADPVARLSLSGTDGPRDFYSLATLTVLP